MFTHLIKQTIYANGLNVETTQQISDGAEIKVVQAVPAATANMQISVALDVGQVKALFIVSDVDLLLETNNATTPTNTLNLKANVPYIWHSDSYDALKLTSDVTQIFLTNDSDEEADFQLLALLDPTP